MGAGAGDRRFRAALRLRDGVTRLLDGGHEHDVRRILRCGRRCIGPPRDRNGSAQIPLPAAIERDEHRRHSVRRPFDLGTMTGRAALEIGGEAAGRNAGSVDRSKRDDSGERHEKRGQ